MRSTGRSPGSSHGMRALRASRPGANLRHQRVVGLGMDEHRPAGKIERQHVVRQFRIGRFRQHGAAIAHRLELGDGRLGERQDGDAGIERLRHPGMRGLVEDGIDVAADQRLECFGVRPRHACRSCALRRPSARCRRAKNPPPRRRRRTCDAGCDPAWRASGCAASVFGPRCLRSASARSRAAPQTRSASHDGMTAMARTGIGFLKMPSPRSATDSTAAGLIIARSISRAATAKMPSAELTPENVTGLPPRECRKLHLGQNIIRHRVGGGAARHFRGDFQNQARARDVGIGDGRGCGRHRSVDSRYGVTGTNCVVNSTSSAGSLVQRSHIDEGLLQRRHRLRIEAAVVDEHPGLEIVILAAPPPRSDAARARPGLRFRRDGFS